MGKWRGFWDFVWIVERLVYYLVDFDRSLCNGRDSCVCRLDYLDSAFWMLVL